MLARAGRSSITPCCALMVCVSPLGAASSAPTHRVLALREEIALGTGDAEGALQCQPVAAAPFAGEVRVIASSNLVIARVAELAQAAGKR